MCGSKLYLRTQQDTVGLESKVAPAEPRRFTPHHIHALNKYHWNDNSFGVFCNLFLIYLFTKWLCLSHHSTVINTLR